MNNDMGKYVLISTMVIHTLNLFVRDKPMPFTKALFMSIGWFGISILSYYMLGHEAGNLLWVLAMMFGFVYLVIYFLDKRELIRSGIKSMEDIKERMEERMKEEKIREPTTRHE